MSGAMTDILFLDLIGIGAVGTYDAAASEIQVIVNIDGGAASGGRSFLIQGPGIGTVTVTTYGAVGEQIVGSFNLTAIEVDGELPPNPIDEAILSGTFDLERVANQAVDQ